MAQSVEEERNILLDNRSDLYHSTQQKHQEMFAKLRAYRQQLVILKQEMADIEQRLTVFRQRQAFLQTQLQIWHQKWDSLSVLMEEKERR
jgi:hypothetical protein